jgi:cytochrome c553
MLFRFRRPHAFLAALLLNAALAAHAAPGDANAGARIASAGVPPAAPSCASCHGAHGEGGPGFPHLAGTGADYLREQLEAFASGKRKNPVMQPIAKALSEQQRGDAAAYYASLPATVHAVDRMPQSSSDLGAWLATRGRWSDDIPACAQCHGPGGIGVGASFPPLAGQTAAYLTAQLRAMQSGDRPAGPLGLMGAIARKLNDKDIVAASDYYAGLQPALAQPAPAAAGKKVAQ